METAIADRPAQIQAAAIGYSRHLLRTQSRAEAHLNGEEESKTDTCIAQEVEHRVNVAKIRMHPTGLVDVEMLSNLLGVNRFAHCEKTCHFILCQLPGARRFGSKADLTVASCLSAFSRCRHL
jgi:hypothetical protein